MLSDSASNIGHSANVQAILRIDGEDLPLASIGPDFCIVREAQEIPEGSRAELIVTVDGTRYVWDVVLKYGAVPFENRVEFMVGA